jgi:hypothetical protein
MAGLATQLRSELAARMGITEDTLSRAIGSDLSGLTVINELWQNLLAAFGSERRVHSFLHEENPELGDKAPVYFLDQGEPQVVLNLVYAIRENLP